MSIRKIVGLLAGFALAVGLIGAGVGAQFTGQVSAQQNVVVGTFGCKITSATVGDISTDGSSVYYNAADINSSTAGTRPMSFTVASTGTIPVVLNIVATPVPLPFTDLLSPTTSQTLTTNESVTYTAGISWTELNNSNLGQSASIAYVVNCNEENANPVTTVTYHGTPNGKGVQPTDLFAGTGFLPGANLSVFMLRMGSPVVFNVNSVLGATTVGPTGSWSQTWGDDCRPSDLSAAVHVDMPVVIWASDGTRSAIGSGVVPCGQF